MELNKDQLTIINNWRGAYLIAAPVGTGKTTVLVERTVKIIEEGGDPASILCLTFTNRAAEEMRARLKIRLDDPNIFNSLTITTFHGLCAVFLRQEAERLGLPADFAIADEVEQSEILGGLLNELPNWPETNFRDRANMIDRFYRHRLDSELAQLDIQKSPAALPQPWQAISEAYYQQLIKQNLLDFNELVIWTLRGLYHYPALLEKWSQRWQFIQLDEFQDTHLSEYLVVKQLSRKHKNIMLVGDLCQTIYGWRGSRPQFVADLFKRHFAPVQELTLTVNYRSSPDLLTAAQSVLSAEEVGGVLPASITVQAYADGASEATALIEEIKELRSKQSEAKIAVLLRNNAPISALAERFNSAGIAHLTVDQYNFFRRQEVRDALAWLKLTYNRYDADSLRRVLHRLAQADLLAAANDINRVGAGCGLRAADFLDFALFGQNEPFAELLKNWRQGRLVVLDTETTGTNPETDEVVQVFAQEMLSGQPGRRLHLYLKPSKAVGLSYYIHRLSDEYLATNGQEPAQALRQLSEFIGSDPLVGHNVAFDINILATNCLKRGVVWPAVKTFDTLDIARRFIAAESYKLSVLAKNLSLSAATHSADDDVAATVDLLRRLIEPLSSGTATRAQLFKLYAKNFISLATTMAKWRLSAKAKRPVEVLEQVLAESGLLDYYQRDSIAEKRLASIDNLKKLFIAWDESAEPSETALKRLIGLGALVKNLDFLGLDKGRVPIVTIHQVKGLEFDYVLMPQLTDAQLPGKRQDVDLAEERRVFYVALTRAKSGVRLSYPIIDANGRPQAPSRFIQPWL